MAEVSEAAAIIVPTVTGESAREVSKHRPRRPIVACTPSQGVQQQLMLDWAVVPLALDPRRTSRRCGALHRGRPARRPGRPGRSRRHHLGHERQPPGRHEHDPRAGALDLCALGREREGLLARAGCSPRARLRDQRAGLGRALQLGLQLRVLAVELGHLGAQLLRRVRACRYERTGPTQSTTSSTSNATAPRRRARCRRALRAGRGRGGTGTASPSAPVLLPAATLPLVESATRARPRGDRAPARTAAACARGRRGALLARRPERDRPAALRRARHAVPDDVLALLPRARACRRRARVGRRHRRARARAGRSARACAASRRLADARVAALRARSTRAARAPTAARRFARVSRAGRRGAAQVPARPRRRRPRRPALRVRAARARARPAPAPEGCCAWA